MQDLPAGMHPRIGSSRPVHDRRPIEHLAQRLLDNLLNRQSVALALPPGIVGSSIGESQSVDHERWRQSRRKNGTQMAAKTHGINGSVLN